MGNIARIGRVALRRGPMCEFQMRILIVALRVVALGVALLGLPSAAKAQSCVSEAQCLSGGGELVGSFCSGGSFNGRPICGGSQRRDVIDQKSIERILRIARIDVNLTDPSVTSALSEEEDMAKWATALGREFAQWLQGLGWQQQPPPPPSPPWLAPGGQGSPIFNLGMYITPATTSGLDAGAGFAVARSSGYGVTDAAGLLTPGSKTANFTGTSAGGIVGGFLDLGGLLPANQSLLLRAYYGYFGGSRSFGDAPELGIVGLNIGSVKQDAHTLGSSVSYSVGSFYARGMAALNVGRGSLTNTANSSTGSYSTDGYAADLRIGNLFTLVQGAMYLRPIGDAKAPPRPVPAYIIGLDLSGHVGYRNARAKGFTDSAGFVYGVENLHYGDVGARAKLLAFVPGYGMLWKPYVAATVDQRFGFSYTAAFPNQVQLPGGDLVTYSQAHTFWGVEGGVDVLKGRETGWRVGAKGFYTASSDTNVTGGQLYIKVPLFQGPPVLR